MASSSTVPLTTKRPTRSLTTSTPDGKLEAKDLPGAMAIYEEVLASAGARADVLVTISGDLGVHGHMAPLIELIAPRYDAEKHGPRSEEHTSELQSH